MEQFVLYKNHSTVILNANMFFAKDRFNHEVRSISGIHTFRHLLELWFASCLAKHQGLIPLQFSTNIGFNLFSPRVLFKEHITPTIKAECAK